MDENPIISPQALREREDQADVIFRGRLNPRRAWLKVLNIVKTNVVMFSVE